MKAYKFPLGRARSKANLPDPPFRLEAQAEAEQVGLIQGRRPGSREEWRVAQALNKLHVRYRYQVGLFGSRRLRGSQVLDFLVYNPYPQPLQVFGEYWHPGELDPQERLQLIQLENYYRRPVIVLWARDLADQELADQAVREALRL